MKKNLKKIIKFSFICVFSFLVCMIYTKIQYKKEVIYNIKTIPNFTYQNINGETFTNKNLKKNIPTLFIYYNSECEFCNEEGQMIYDNIEKFNNFQLIFVSYEKPDLIKAFASKYKLNTYKNINFLYDVNVNFAKTFDIKSMPCLVLYNKNKKLIEKINGQTKIKTLIRKLKKE